MKTIIFSLAIVACTAVSFADEPDMRKYSDEADKTAQTLRERIQEEIKTLSKHVWAGEYYAGDGLGMNVYLSLAPKAGYVYEWHGCMGLYDRDYGAVEEKEGRLHLSFTFEHHQSEFFGIAEELVPVSWGERRYLVSARGFIDFCNEINAGSEPRKGVHGMTLLCRGDEQKKATGLPSVPKAFEPYLLSKPIETEIIAIGDTTKSSKESAVREIRIRVTVKYGSKAGLLSGMKLYVVKPNSVFDSIVLDKVDEGQSEGVITRYSLAGVMGLLSLLDNDPKIGWKLSTRRP